MDMQTRIRSANLSREQRNGIRPFLDEAWQMANSKIVLPTQAEVSVYVGEEVL